MKLIKESYKYLLTLSLLTLMACTTDKPKIDPKLEYKDFIQEETIKADSSVAAITIPTAEENQSWNSSNFSLLDIPENIATTADINKLNVKNYRLYSGSSDANHTRTVVIHGDSIFALSDNILYSYELASPNKLKWSVTVSMNGKNLIGGGIYAQDKYLAVTSGSKDLVLLDASSGNILWTYTLMNISRSTPLIYKNLVFINTVDNSMYAIDLNTGFLKWIIKEAHEKLGFLGASSPEAFKETIIMPFSSGKLAALNIETGQAKWSASLSLGIGNKSYVNDIDIVPVIKKDTVFLSSLNGILYSIDANTGSLNWSNPHAGGHSQIWVADDYIYTINKNNQVLALHKKSGTINWIYDLEPQNIKKKESLFFDDPYYTFKGPTMIGGYLYIVSSNGSLIIIDPKSGKLASNLGVSRNIYSPSLAVGNKIYLINESGVLSVVD